MTKEEKELEKEYEKECAWLDTGHEGADFILLSGTQSYFAGTDNETLTPYERKGDIAPFYRLFRRGISSKLQMLCVNPDLTEQREGQTSFIDGYLAKVYADMGGEVLYFGKPGNSAFESARVILEDLDVEENICHIGCSIRNDCTGAKKNGLDSALVVATGEHNMDFEELNDVEVERYAFERELQAPSAAMPRFQWTFDSDSSGVGGPDEVELALPELV